MKRIAFIIAFLALVLAPGFAFAQAIIENPAKPDNPRAGRVVTVKEEMRIVDTGRDFFIKYPSGRYLDSFYLKWSDKEVDINPLRQKFTFAGGFVYFADKTADDLVVIRKCRLVGLWAAQNPSPDPPAAMGF